MPIKMLHIRSSRPQIDLLIPFGVGCFRPSPCLSVVTYCDTCSCQACRGILNGSCTQATGARCWIFLAQMFFSYCMYLKSLSPRPCSLFRNPKIASLDCDEFEVVNSSALLYCEIYSEISCCSSHPPKSPLVGIAPMPLNMSMPKQ